MPKLNPEDVKREADVEEMASDDDDLEAEDVDAPPRPDPVTPPIDTSVTMPDTEHMRPQEFTVVDGFRIQVFASGTRESALVAREEASMSLGMPAYLDIVAGLFKVRVGNFLTRESAESALLKVRGGGYEDAWIVAAQVRAGSSQ